MKHVRARAHARTRSLASKQCGNQPNTRTGERGRLKIFTHQWKESIKLIRRVRLDDRPTGCLGVQLTREIKLTVNVRARSSTESTNQRPTSDRRICIAKQRISVNDTAAAVDFKRRKRMKRFFFLIFHSHPSEVG
ncbi:Chaperonin GroEL [Trichinella spiralis]|uniref:Chaperonin GroEL n=1 Tax=Trichinella spiralis TaxID=6334 RepID=A0ABR3KU53_TRISP